MSDLLRCPVHVGCDCFEDRRPFKHNIRLKSGDDPERKPELGSAFIYLITHTGTGLYCVGYTTESLSKRWGWYRDLRNTVKKLNNPDPINRVYRAMIEDGLHMFVMEKLEECGQSIMLLRELDYMRQFDSWNPRKGYNKPFQKESYARKLYFLLNPGQKAKYKTLTDDCPTHATVNGWFKPIPPNQKWKEELQKLEDISQREGRKAMKRISSLASPVILASPPPKVE